MSITDNRFTARFVIDYDTQTYLWICWGDRVIYREWVGDRLYLGKDGPNAPGQGDLIANHLEVLFARAFGPGTTRPQAPDYSVKIFPYPDRMAVDEFLSRAGLPGWTVRYDPTTSALVVLVDPEGHEVSGYGVSGVPDGGPVYLATAQGVDSTQPVQVYPSAQPVGEEIIVNGEQSPDPEPQPEGPVSYAVRIVPRVQEDIDAFLANLRQIGNVARLGNTTDIVVRDGGEIVLVGPDGEPAVGITGQPPNLVPIGTDEFYVLAYQGPPTGENRYWNEWQWNSMPRRSYLAGAYLVTAAGVERAN